MANEGLDAYQRFASDIAYLYDIRCDDGNCGHRVQTQRTQWQLDRREVLRGTTKQLARASARSHTAPLSSSSGGSWRQQHFHPHRPSRPSLRSSVVGPSRRGIPPRWRNSMKVLFIQVSQNAKTGPIPVSIIERASCWSGCARYENGCDDETGALAMHWDRVSRGPAAGSWSEFCAKIAALRPGPRWRYAQAGDLPGYGPRIYGSSSKSSSMPTSAKTRSLSPTSPSSATTLPLCRTVACRRGRTGRLHGQSLGR